MAKRVMGFNVIVRLPHIHQKKIMFYPTLRAAQIAQVEYKTKGYKVIIEPGVNNG